MATPKAHSWPLVRFCGRREASSVPTLEMRAFRARLLRVAVVGYALSFIFLPCLHAQNQNPSVVERTQQPTAARAESSGAEQSDPARLVREVVHNEIEMQLTDNSLWCFRQEKEEDSKPRKTLEVCETPDGDLERVIAVDGHELSPAETQAEDERIQKLIEHPAQLRAKQKKEHEDAEQERTFLRAVPDAFEFQYLASEGNLVKMHFRPSPTFHKASRAAAVFHHMEGTLVVDRKEKRIVEIFGRLTSEVRFGGGLLGHLDEGGTFFVKAGEVVPGHWDAISMNLDMSGRALFFKTIAVHEQEQDRDYTPVPADASLAQVVDLLRKECNYVHTASRQ